MPTYTYLGLNVRFLPLVALRYLMVVPIVPIKSPLEMAKVLQKDYHVSLDMTYHSGNLPVWLTFIAWNLPGQSRGGLNGGINRIDRAEGISCDREHM